MFQSVNTSFQRAPDLPHPDPKHPLLFSFLPPFFKNNKIQRLLRGHFSPTTAMLWLYSNNISYIQASTFHGFARLEELDLGDNRHLRSLAADTFHGLGRLHALHLYRCGLSALPSNIFQGLRNLQYLYLQVR